MQRNPMKRRYAETMVMLPLPTPSVCSTSPLFLVAERRQSFRHLIHRAPCLREESQSPDPRRNSTDDPHSRIEELTSAPTQLLRIC